MPRARTTSPPLPPPTEEAVERGPPTPPPLPPPPTTDTLLATLAQRLESLEAAVLRGPTTEAHREGEPSPTFAPAATDDDPPHSPSPRRLHRSDTPAPAAVPVFDHRSDADSGSDADEVAAPHRRSTLQDYLYGADRHLPCPHVYHNPYPRAPQLHHRACHYSPARAGDATHGEIHRSVQRTHDKLLIEVCKEELCTLVPVLSTLFDLQEYVADVCAEAQRAHQLPGAAVREALRTIAAQLNAARTLANERLDAVEAATRSRSEWAAHARAIYGQERALTGARAPLGDHLAASVQSRTISAHHGAIARAEARAVTFQPTTRATRNSARSASEVFRAHEHALLAVAEAAASEAEERLRRQPHNTRLNQAADRARAAARAAAKAARALLLHPAPNRSCAASWDGSPRRDATAADPRTREAAGPGAASGLFFTHVDRVRSRLQAWLDIGAPRRVLSWLRDGVHIQWNGRGPPAPFHHGVSSFTPAERAWLTLERDRCLTTGAWVRASDRTHVSRAFVTYHRGKPRLVIDLRFINLHTRKCACVFEPLSSLRRMCRKGDWMWRPPRGLSAVAYHISAPVPAAHVPQGRLDVLARPCGRLPPCAVPCERTALFHLRDRDAEQRRHASSGVLQHTSAELRVDELSILLHRSHESGCHLPPLPRSHGASPAPRRAHVAMARRFRVFLRQRSHAHTGASGKGPRVRTLPQPRPGGGAGQGCTPLTQSTSVLGTRCRVEYFSTPVLNFGWTNSPFYFTEVMKAVVPSSLPWKKPNLPNNAARIKSY
eukprot:CAMPEP_0184403492 /NCGR_PEP_ID=MMETSP0007-20130409/85436_1 /TAXON_ID=97485 /ORGANISM="Prymnesium parvum, Strain Texoma1" /LENGTH=776 /DNA_ID=CAMNT_0026759595 /DNA_START=125 /DNA_END=2456 /DNA_ORIENTATION=-